jgi:hypothetical protein
LKRQRGAKSSRGLTDTNNVVIGEGRSFSNCKNNVFDKFQVLKMLSYQWLTTSAHGTPQREAKREPR